MEKGAKDAAAQVEALTKRAQDEADGVKADEEDLAQVTKLFKAPGGYLFRCRRCYNLTYASQNETGEWRAYRRLRKFEARLERAKDAVPMDYLDGYTPPLKTKRDAVANIWAACPRGGVSRSQLSDPFRRGAGQDLGFSIALRA